MKISDFIKSNFKFKDTENWIHTIQNGLTVAWILPQTLEKYTDPKHPTQPYAKCECRLFASEKYQLEGMTQPRAPFLKIPQQVLSQILSAIAKHTLDDHDEFGILILRKTNGRRITYSCLFQKKEAEVDKLQSLILTGRYSKVYELFHPSKKPGK